MVPRILVATRPSCTVHRSADTLAHPDSPAGGSGPGFSRPPGPTGYVSSHFPDPYSPAGRLIHWDSELRRRRTRSVALTVSGAAIGEGQTWAYPNGAALGKFLIPIYTLTVAGTDNSGRQAKDTFSVFRFGVQSEDGKTARVVGLADHQTHVIKAWLPAYIVHSAMSREDGAWQVYDTFLIHDGPDNDTDCLPPSGVWRSWAP